jgi:hypothetical protein
MKDNDLFFDLDDETIDMLAQEFPVLTDEEKERMYAMSERKYNISENTNEEYSSETEVSGVERYSRPKWKTASVAASLALLIGAGSFGGYNIAKQLHSGTEDDPNVPTTVSEDMSQVNTEDPRTEEYRSITDDLLNKYNDFLAPYNEDELPKSDENSYIERADGMTDEEWEAAAAEYQRKESEIHDQIWFEFGTGDQLDYPNYNLIKSWSYDHFKTGMKYSNTDEVMEKALSFMSQSLIDKQFPDLIGDDLSGYESNTYYNKDTDDYPDFGVYAMRDGKLYCAPLDYDANGNKYIPSTYRFYNCLNEPAVITDITDDSFTAVVKYEFTNIPNKYDMTMKLVNKDGSWFIDDIEPTGPEVDQQKLDIIEKMMNSGDYYDKISVKYGHFYKAPEGSPAEIRDYSVKIDVTYADNRTARKYSYGYYADRYNGSEDIASMVNYAKNTFSADHEKEDEDYCDGEKYYYWHNPTELDPDYSWYDWNNRIYHDEDADKYGGFDSLRMNSERMLNCSRDTYKPFICPNGQLIATNYLYEFSNWDITGETTFESRECCIIEMDIPDYLSSYSSDYNDKLTAYIDKETGIPMLVEMLDENGDLVEANFYYDVKLNDQAESVPEKDMSWFDTGLSNFK